MERFTVLNGEFYMRKHLLFTLALYVSQGIGHQLQQQVSNPPVSFVLSYPLKLFPSVSSPFQLCPFPSPLPDVPWSPYLSLTLRVHVQVLTANATRCFADLTKSQHRKVVTVRFSSYLGCLRWLEHSSDVPSSDVRGFLSVLPETRHEPSRGKPFFSQQLSSLLIHHCGFCSSVVFTE